MVDSTRVSYLQFSPELLLFLTAAAGGSTWFISKLILDSRERKKLKQKQKEGIDYEQPSEKFGGILVENLRPVIHEGPEKLTEFIGQKLTKKYIKLHLDYCLANDKPFPHVVFYGHGGLGKSSLGKVIAQEMGVKFTEVTPAIIGSSDMMMGVFFRKVCPNCSSVLPYTLKKCRYCQNDISMFFEVIPKVEEKEIVFLEECHSLSKNIEEAMYSVMQESYMVVRVSGQIVEAKLPPITIAGATTKLGNLNDPFRQRFSLQIRLEPYELTAIEKIVKQYCKKKEISIADDVVTAVAKMSHGTPRIARALITDLKTMSDYVEMEHFKQLIVMKKLDRRGLNDTHRRVLIYLSRRKTGGAGAIASFCHLTKSEYEEVYEPVLMFHDLIMQTARGRTLTEKAKKLYASLLEENK